MAHIWHGQPTRQIWNNVWETHGVSGLSLASCGTKQRATQLMACLKTPFILLKKIAFLQRPLCADVWCRSCVCCEQKCMRPRYATRLEKASGWRIAVPVNDHNDALSSGNWPDTHEWSPYTTLSHDCKKTPKAATCWKEFWTQPSHCSSTHHKKWEWLNWSCACCNCKELASRGSEPWKHTCYSWAALKTLLQ